MGRVTGSRSCLFISRLFEISEHGWNSQRAVFSLTYIFRRRYTKYPLLSMIAASETKPTIKRFARKGLTLISPFFFFFFFTKKVNVSFKNLYGRTFRVSKMIYLTLHEK